MHLSRSTGVVKLSAAETRQWRRCGLPSARGRDLGWRWSMRASLVILARGLAQRTGRPTASVQTSDGEVLMVIPAEEPRVMAGAAARRTGRRLGLGATRRERRASWPVRNCAN